MTMQECYKAIGGNYEAVLGRLLRNNRKANIPIVAMTANAFEEDKKKAFKAGMNAHIAKPIDINTILAVFDQVFGV
ncbi:MULTISPECIES: response regulator [Dorea]|jgi:CheY-like chemotaxis protein|uniref:Stage 0 sporulation protein A homolog n=1 Tax=Dorea longicatena TaxID=88431 RepID=A0A414T2T2_9FIRM|nr:MULTISPECIES: response regulator [Dorea]RGU07995.1 response regulator [Dorea longicatena]RHG07280.1 response regulator [Dorea longicatena]RHG28460.1 response regulator [Dorea longicatena]